MFYLSAVTVLWALSFSLIGVYLSGHVDSYFAVLTRIVLAGALFLPFLRLTGLPRKFIAGLIVTGAFQFGITYVCLYRSFEYLSVPEVLLFTIFTPLYVSLFNDIIERRFSLPGLVCTGIAVAGAAVIRYDEISNDYITGFLILQLANLTFATGQVGYAQLIRHFKPASPPWRSFALFFAGALLVVLPAYLLFGDAGKLPSTPVQWSVLGWLGLVASGLGFYFWNLGAVKVDGGTLGIMNNALIPAGLIINVLIWNRDADLIRLTAGGGIIVASLYINHRWSAFWQRGYNNKQFKNSEK